MRGGIGLYVPKHEFASSVTTSYDASRGVYTGEIFSREGLYRVEAWDQGTLDSQLDYILEKEYHEMEREVTVGKSRPFGANIGDTIKTPEPEPHVTPHGELHKTSHITPHTVQHTKVAPRRIESRVTRHMEGGLPVMTIHTGSPHKTSGLGKVVEVFDIASIAMSILTGNWMDVLFGALSMAFQDALGGGGGKTMFAVSFGGIMITAPSRRLLLKKLQRHKNRRIQIIMHHMRSHDKNRREASSTGNLSKGLSRRIQDKKRLARISWSDKMLSKGQAPGWRGRSLTLKNGLGDRRDRAKVLWAERA